MNPEEGAKDRAEAQARAEETVEADVTVAPFKKSKKKEEVVEDDVL